MRMERLSVNSKPKIPKTLAMCILKLIINSDKKPIKKEEKTFKRPKLTFRQLRDTNLAKLTPPVEPIIPFDSLRIFIPSPNQSSPTPKIQYPKPIKPKTVLTARPSLGRLSEFHPFEEPEMDEREVVKSRLQERFKEKLDHRHK
jgi:hypothetical protein